MLKIGCNWLSVSEMDLESFIKSAYDWKLDVIDIHERALISMEKEYLFFLRKLCWECGLPMGYIGVSTNFVGSKEVLEKEVEHCKKIIDAAVCLGSPLIRVFAGKIPLEIKNKKVYYKKLYQCLREAADYGAEKGIMVGLQNHDNNNMASTGNEIVNILKKTDHPYLTFILDTGNWKGSIGAAPIGNKDPDVDIYQHIAQTASYCTYVRTKFYTIESGVEKWLDYNRIFNILKDINYNGFISIVYEGDGEPIEAVKNSRDYIKKLADKYL